MYIPKPTDGGDFELAPKGNFVAICYRVLDLGTQKSSWQGQAKETHKITLSWELPTEKMKEGQPFSVHKRYTWSMGEKASLRKDLESWRGRAFSDADFGENGFDIKNILGKACLLNIVHETNGDKTYANIASIGPLVKGMTVPKQTNATVYLWINRERWSEEVFNGLSDGLKKTVIASPEYTALKSANGPVPQQAYDGDFPQDEEVIPF